MNWAASMPPTKAPTEKPVNIQAVSAPRMRVGAYSDVRAKALGMQAPSPMPVRNRNTISSSRLVTRDVARVATAKMRTLTIITQRRPSQSASGARNRQPTRIPNRPAEKTVASSCG